MKDTALITAIHEAGHVVADLVIAEQQRLPSPVNAVWIMSEDDGWSGMCESGPARWQEVHRIICGAPGTPSETIEHCRKIAWQDCISYLAGPVAETRWRYRSRTAAQLYGYQLADRFADGDYSKGSDFGRTRVRLTWRNSAKVNESILAAWIESEELIARHWKRVVEFARWLARDGQISGDDINDWWARGSI